MKNLILYFTFIIPQFLCSQIEIPTEISVKLYSGGDYRSKGEKGAYDNVDSINYVLLPEFNIYHSNKIFQERKIFMYVDIEKSFDTRNINEDSTMTIYTDLAFSFEEMKDLLYWLDEDNYAEIILRDSFYFIEESSFKWTDTLLISPELSIADFGIDTTRFQRECDFYSLILDEEKTCDKVDYDFFFNHLLKENMGFASVSSYTFYVQFQLTFNEYDLTVWQKYSGDMNIEWWIDKEGEERMTVLSPHLNSILVKLLPYDKRKSWGLEEYRNKEKLIRKYLFMAN